MNKLFKLFIKALKAFLLCIMWLVSLLIILFLLISAIFLLFNAITVGDLPFDPNTVKSVVFYESFPTSVDMDYEQNPDLEKELSDKKPIYRLDGQDAQMFFKETKADHKLINIIAIEVRFIIDIETENRHYYGIIRSRRCTYRINGWNGRFIGKSQQIVKEQREISIRKSKEISGEFE